MAPPGRRRNLLTNLIMIFGLFLLFSSTASAAAAILGIDLGTEYIKAALVKPGIPLEIVLTKDSKRKEASAVAFKPSRSGAQASGSFPERLYGSDALALTARFPGDVYPNLKHLLGLPAEGSPEVEEYGKRYPALNAVRLEERDTVGFKSNSFNLDEPPFSVEELLAMQLKNVRQNAQALAGKGLAIQNAVITISTFYTAEERKATELAADLAGLNVLALVSDGLAVGLNYATSRTFPSVSEGAKPEYHMVFDMGAGSTTATVLRFQSRSVKDVGRFNKTVQEVSVLGAGWDKTLGGDSLNGLIVDHMVEQFLNTPSAKKLGTTPEAVRGHGRAAAKLLKEAERVRQVLSANSNTGTSFEGLYDDVDFRYKLSRAEFEEMASGFADRVEVPIKKALEAAKLTFDDLDSVILHGGAVRTPFVQKQLESLAGDSSKLRSNVNADEAAVFGAAFKGAGLSPSFKVKEIRTNDAASYAVTIQWTSEGKDRQQKLFTPTSLIGATKQIPFKNLDDFSFTLSQQVSASGHADTTIEMPVLQIQTQNLTASVTQLVDKFACSRDAISTKFSIRLDPVDGLPEVVQGTVSCEVESEDKKGGVVDDVKGFFGFGSKKGEQEPLKDAEASPAEAEDKTATTSAGESQASEATTKEDEKTKMPKKRTETINIGFTVARQGFKEPSQAELKRMKDRLAAFDASDKERRRREEALNTLEAFTYRARDILSDEGFIASSTPEQRSKIEKLLTSTSEWLYSEGADSTADALNAKLKDLKDLVDPIQKRRDEARKRPEQVRLLKDALAQTETLVKMMNKQIEEGASKSSSASEEAARSAVSSATASAEASTSGDPLDDLEEDVETSSTSTTTSTTSTAPQPTDFLSPYSPEDVAELTKSYDSINAWLTSKLEEQDKLADYEDPVIISSELEAKARQLNEAIMQLLNKKIKMKPTSSRPPKPKATKKPKKPKKSPDATEEQDAKVEQAPKASESITVSLGEAGAAPTPGAEPSVRDEL